MEMMRAVLDTNFWLATHVVTVTLGYASTFVAGFLAIIYILRGVFTDHALGGNRANRWRGWFTASSVSPRCSASSARCWAASGPTSRGAGSGAGTRRKTARCSSCFGTPTILHARWGGLVRERGLMNLAVFGNIVTSWSWFGVNMLGIGLHSYGFTDAAFHWLMLFVASQLAIILLGLMPQKLWRSFHNRTPNAA